MRIAHVFALACAALLPAAACDQKPTPAPSSAPPAPPAPATAKPSASALPAEKGATPSVPEHMKDHFTHGEKIRNAIVLGDLATMKKDAQWMAEHELSKSFPETWKPHVTRFQNTTKQVLDSPKTEDAAKPAAEMAATCGACHAALGGPKLTLGEPPAEGSGATLHMARHQWAAARMWDALTTPSEEAWLKAAEVMADAPLVPKAVSGEKSVDKKAEDLAVRVHKIAEQNRGARDVKKWTSAYGDFLQTCADCHKLVGVKMKVPEK